MVRVVRKECWSAPEGMTIAVDVVVEIEVWRW